MKKETAGISLHFSVGRLLFLEAFFQNLHAIILQKTGIKSFIFAHFDNMQAKFETIFGYYVKITINFEVKFSNVPIY